MNIKYNISNSDSYHADRHPFLSILPKKSRIKSTESNAFEIGGESVSISELPTSTLSMIEAMDQDILEQGLEGLKTGLSACLKIRRTPCGFAWKMV